MLFHRHRVVGAALDGGIVGDDQTFPTGDPADARDHPGTGTLVVVHAVGRQCGDLQERAARIKQAVNPIAGQQLAPVDVALTGPFRAAEGGGGELGAQLPNQRQMLVAVR
nr:hypothetical protein CPGR_01163 [Mycolicibacterium fortuitum subsp. fortuitum DSM 46621 = ATCC 6841 = JCM 6387]